MTIIKMLKELLDAFYQVSEQTDTYCNWCETHSEKEVDEKGAWTGKAYPLHTDECIIGKAEDFLYGVNLLKTNVKK